MSTLNVLYSALTESFDFNFIELNPYYCDIFAGIKKHVDVIEFDNLKFGYELIKLNEVVASRIWPDPGVTYIRTDQEILDGDRVNWEPSTEYTLTVWFENWGKRYKGQLSFTTPDEISNLDVI